MFTVTVKIEQDNLRKFTGRPDIELVTFVSTREEANRIWSAALSTAGVPSEEDDSPKGASGADVDPDGTVWP